MDVVCAMDLGPATNLFERPLSKRVGRPRTGRCRWVSFGHSGAAHRPPMRLLPAAILIALVVLAAPTAGVAHAAAPEAEFTFSPAAPVVGQTVRFTASVSDPDNDIASVTWDLNDDGEFDDETGTSASTRFDTAGRHRVTLRVVDEEDNVTEVDHTVNVGEAPPNQPPTAAFTFSPAAPNVGEAVTFRSGSSDDGSVVSERWDLDDDGAFDDATGTSATQAFAVPGTHVVGLQATDDRGASSIAFRSVEVTAPAAAAPTITPRRARLRLLSPFPIVRIVGTFVGRTVKITRLAVRASRGAVVRVLCRGRACPARRLSQRPTSYARPVRFRRFERRLRVGTVLEIFVSRPGRIGKYTRFVIRGGAAPLRRDSCVRAGAVRPSRCPG
jgi:plastocyanin